MLRARCVFVDVDTQFDFMSPAGKLYVTGASEIIENLRRLTEYARRQSIPIIASACAHRDGDPEFQVFPPHCVRGTPGQCRIPETDHGDAPIIGIVPDRDAAAKFEKAGVVVLEKEVYDFFSNPNADRLIAAAPAAEFVVYGVATDYCVRAGVLGLCDRGRSVTVVCDAVRPVDARQGKLAVEEFERRKVRFATTNEICSR
jgi:nicotinamidase/pyrazinamidase